MVEALEHSPELGSARYADQALGYYVGWVEPADELRLRPHTSDDETTVVVLAGECYHSQHEQECGSWVLQQYALHGEAFVRELNGLFSGFLIDKCRGTALLFNDRYGIERVYWREEAGAFAFASEAKALLKTQRAPAQFDTTGVGELAAFGCTLGRRSLFQGISVLPGGSLWSFSSGHVRRTTYFDRSEWESQPTLSPAAFESEFATALRSAAAPYFRSTSRIGLALTGGLDTRMVLACRPARSAELISYTYDGPAGAILDVEVARRVAAAAGLQHEVLRLGPDFFSDFQTHADRTVFVTDGYYGPLGAHELYLSSRARKLAPIRLTGVFGGEVLRGVGALKPHRLGAGLLDPAFERAAHASCETRRVPLHPVSSAVFGDTPAALHGSLKACRTELRFRTPFLDNTLVKLAYRAPAEARSASDEAVRLVAAASPHLARIPTDRGHSLGAGGLRLKPVRRLMAEATFKLDYWVNDGMPNWLVKSDPLLDYLHSPVRLLGRHKYLRYRRWLRRELAEYLQERLDAAAKLPFFDRRGIERLGVEHLSGRRNRARDIGTVLTIEATYRLLMRR